MSQEEYYAKEIPQQAGTALRNIKGDQQITPLELLKQQKLLHDREGERLDKLIAFVEKNPEMVEQMQALRRYL